MQPSTSKEAANIEDESTKDVSPVMSESDDEGDPPPSPQDVKENIKQKFLVEMPQDFYDFWDFAKSLHAKKPEGVWAFKEFTYDFINNMSNYTTCMGILC